MFHKSCPWVTVFFFFVTVSKGTSSKKRQCTTRNMSVDNILDMFYIFKYSKYYLQVSNAILPILIVIIIEAVVIIAVLVTAIGDISIWKVVVTMVMTVIIAIVTI